VTEALDEKIKRTLAQSVNETPAPVIAVEVNDSCVSRCAHCSYGHARAERLVELELLLAAVDDAAAYGCRLLTVAAREPFSPTGVDRTLAVIRRALAAGFERVGAITSARLLPRTYQSLADAGLVLTQLDTSVDGLEATHDALRDVKEWPYIEDWLNRDAARRATRGLGVSITAQSGNLLEIVPLLRWLGNGPDGAPRVDRALVATVSMGARNDPACALVPGDFERLLDALEAWYAEERPDEMELALEITPSSVPDICELAERGILRAAEIGINRFGFPVLYRPGGLPIRVMSGLFSVGRVVRIMADGQYRLCYEQYSGQKQPRYSLQTDPLGQTLAAEHGSGKIFHTALQIAPTDTGALSSDGWLFDGKINDPLDMDLYA